MKKRVGNVLGKKIVIGDINLLSQNEYLLAEQEIITFCDDDFNGYNNARLFISGTFEGDENEYKRLITKLIRLINNRQTYFEYNDSYGNTTIGSIYYVISEDSSYTIYLVLPGFTTSDTIVHITYYLNNYDDETTYAIHKGSVK